MFACAFKLLFTGKELFYFIHWLIQPKATYNFAGKQVFKTLPSLKKNSA